MTPQFQPASHNPIVKVVRNRGPFPYLQSEGGFVEVPGTRAWKRQNAQPPATTYDTNRRGLKISSVQCGNVLLNDTELEAMVRYRQQVDLQKPLQKLSARRKPLGAKGKPTSKALPAEEADMWLPRKSDPFASPRWADGLSPWDRLSMHHTLNSVRANVRMHRPLVCQSDLEFILDSLYNQSKDLWLERKEVVIQPETCLPVTWKILKNTRVQVSERATIPEESEQTQETEKETPKIEDDHGSHLPVVDRFPLRFGGIAAKLSPHSVKLAISGNHVSQTNAGYSRKVGGSFYS